MTDTTRDSKNVISWLDDTYVPDPDCGLVAVYVNDDGTEYTRRVIGWLVQIEHCAKWTGARYLDDDTPRAERERRIIAAVVGPDSPYPVDEDENFRHIGDAQTRTSPADERTVS